LIEAGRDTGEAGWVERWRVVTDNAVALMCALVLEDGRRWGDAATDVQRADAEAILDADSLTPYSYLTRARGYSKTCDLGGIASSSMLAQLAAGSRLYGLAADKDQGLLLVDSIAGFAARTPELRGALRVDQYRVTALRSGSVLEVLAADAPGAWGLRPDLLIVDELAQWANTAAARSLWEATTSAIAKMRRSRLVVLTTAGDPAHWSRRVLDHALADALWRTHEVPGPAPWLDADRLAEQQRRLRPSMYARLFQNEWTSGEDRLVVAEDLAACVTLDGPQPPQRGRRYVIGVDLGLKRDRSVAAVCHRERNSVILDRLEVWEGTRLKPVKLAVVEEWLAETARAYGAEVVADPWQGASMIQRLRGAGVRIDEYVFSAQSVGRLASTLYELLHERALALPDDEALLDELANVRLRETSPGVVRLDHDPDRHDDRAVALALAAHRLMEKRAASLSRSHVPRGPLERPRRNGGKRTGRVVDVKDFDELARLIGVGYSSQRAR